METLLSAYVLIWPALVLSVLVVIATGFSRDLRRARQSQRDLI